MKTVKVGILSDTHLDRPTELFRKLAEECFADTSAILHAGDLTEMSILEVFKGKELHAVHGNMCSFSTLDSLPKKKIVTIQGVRIGLTHGAGFYHDLEEHLMDEFPEADCIVYGHTHRAVCHRIGSQLIINPGSFRATGRWGAAGTYAILQIGEKLSAHIYEVPKL
ncbi:MAG: YfcE family phosphodiesterase [Proteobacteria bacterium]|nr:YfcE family phosphodiesterase [Pseudomonadota bacterium]MBU1709546.1 YfcE family phosphodiesterase [Pseudomonadota bacterium]